jgi:hypothetical protein
MRKTPLITLSVFAAFGLFMAQAIAISPFGNEHPAAGDTRTSVVITGAEDSAVGRTLILDASASHVTGERTEYRWTIDETKQTIGRNVEAIYTPEKPGKLTFRLTVRSTGLNGQVEETGAIHPVTVYLRKIVMISDGSLSQDKRDAYVKTAMEAGIFVKVVQAPPSTPVLGIEEAIVGQLTEQKETLAGAEGIVVWGEGISGLQALMRAVQGNAEREAELKNQTIILITDRSIGTLARTARGAFSLLKPQQIIVTRKEAITPLFETSGIQEFQSVIE